MRMASKPGSSTALEAGEALAVEGLAFLAAEPARLERFLAVTGLGPHNLRRAAADPAFLVSVLDYLAGDERLVVAFADGAGRRPEEVMRTVEALRGPPPDMSA